VVGQLVKKLITSKKHVAGSKVLVLGLTFKENCPDIRNTKVVDILAELKDYEISFDVFDPWVDSAEAQHEYGITPVEAPAAAAYDAVILAVAHQQFKELGAAGIRKFLKNDGIIYDLKYLLNKADSDIRL
jgi:UDP-N-acetyl-D-galactosamine dehydrogenase